MTRRTAIRNRTTTKEGTNRCGGRTVSRAKMIGVAVAFGSLSLVACGDADAESFLDPDLESVRSATAEYSDVAAAVAAGYAPTPECVAVPELGAMGIHYVNGPLVGDPDIDPDQPEALLYLPEGDGLVLIAVEWISVDADGDTATSDDRPTLFGTPFDGPHDGHGPGEPVHYDLHAWVHEENPAGAFSPFNSALECPAS